MSMIKLIPNSSLIFIYKLTMKNKLNIDMLVGTVSFVRTISNIILAIRTKINTTLFKYKEFGIGKLYNFLNI